MIGRRGDLTHTMCFSMIHVRKEEGRCGIQKEAPGIGPMH